MTDTMPRYCDGRLSCPLGEIGESCELHENDV